MFERLMESLPCARRDAEIQAAAWKRVTWRGWRLENQQAGDKDKCVHLSGNHRACERGACQDGLEGAGPWRATQLPQAVLGQQ